MITVKEFSILKACLQFSWEELGPHCPDSLRGYMPYEQVSTNELRRLVDKINGSRLLFASVVSGNVTFVEPESVPANVDVSQLALVLVPESD